MVVVALIGFLAATLLGFLLTAVIRRLAPCIGLTDHPDAHRKLHGRPIPLGGGLAVFLATAMVLAATFFVPNPWGLSFHQDWLDLVGFGLACTCVVLVGLADDRFHLRGRHKLIGQLVAASILLATGLMIRRFSLFGFPVDLGLLAVPFTLFWLVGAMNAINLLDGMDGLATVLGIVLSLVVALLALMTHHPTVAMIALVLAGSLLGFLWFNLPPARIFLGDAGSMLIGLMVGALAIRASLKGPGTVLLAAPLALWTIPIFDSLAAILRRKLSGRSIYTTDRAHLHHQLSSRLGSSSKALAVIAAFCALTAAAALASVGTNNDLIAVVTSIGVVGIFIATGLFGRAETAILIASLVRMGRSLLHPLRPRKPAAEETVLRLQGSRHWEVLWATLTEAASKLELSRISLDVNLPAIQENYHATWQQAEPADHAQCWRLELPLVIGSQPAGALVILGRPNGEATAQHLERLVDLLEPFEREFRLLTAPDSAAATVGPLTGPQEPPARHPRILGSTL